MRNIKDDLQEVFREVFDDDTIEIAPEMTAADIEDWDSLEHINLAVAVEKKFNIKFNMGEVNTFKNVGEMVDIIISRITA